MVTYFINIYLRNRVYLFFIHYKNSIDLYIYYLIMKPS